MENSKAIGILQAVKAGTADVFISKAAIKDALDMAIAALEQQEKGGCPQGCVKPEPDGYCSYGERKVVGHD